MSLNSKNQTEEEQIDFGMISNKIGNFFQRGNAFIFKGIQFVFKNIVILILLLVIGFGFGIFLDQKYKTYNSEIIVAPNFGSTDYLYSKIDLLAAKVKERDTVFLKSIGIQKPLEIKKISIEPIVDVYKFINNSEKNFELLKLMSEDGDLKSIVKETTTSKNYAFHTITILTKGLTNSKKGIQPILNYLNTSEYYSKVQKISINNIQQKIKANEGIIAQIDGILNEFSNAASGYHQKSDKLVYYNENTQLNDVIKTKDTLIKEIGNLKIKLLTSDKIIKESTIALNIENDKSLNGKRKFVLPFVLIFGFILIGLFGRFYKKQKTLSMLNN